MHSCGTRRLQYNNTRLAKGRASSKGVSDRGFAANKIRLKWNLLLSSGLADSGPVNLRIRDDVETLSHEHADM